MNYEVVNAQGEVFATFSNEKAALGWIDYSQRWIREELFVREVSVTTP